MSENSVEKSLESLLKKIFGVAKVSYAEPGESGEQDCLFVELESGPFKVTDAKVTARVTGRAFINSQNEKLPLGFFSKAVAGAPNELTKHFFFSEFDLNTNRFQNLVQRSVSFIYFFDSQYDPDLGNIETIDITVTLEEPTP